MVLAVGFFSYRVYERNAFLQNPANAEKNAPVADVFVMVKEGRTFSSIARELEEQGVVSSSRLLIRYAVSEKLADKIRVGEFKLNASMTPVEIVSALTTGRGVLHRLFIPEGITMWQVAKRAEAAGFGSAEEFNQLFYDKALLAEFVIPAESLEGYLFPETYFFSFAQSGDLQENVIRTMLQEFYKNAEKTWPEGLPSAEKIHKHITLASIVEKETAAPSERARIAGVYLNRLRKNMRLQADPTTIYGLGKDFDGNLTRNHLYNRNNPYNTYRIMGLPKGPICSPGLAAMQATKNPEKHRLIYFVAKGDGSHVFNETLANHNRAVRKYQLIRRKNYTSTYQGK